MIRRSLQAYGRWFDRMARGTFGLALFVGACVLWALIFSGSLPR